MFNTFYLEKYCWSRLYYLKISSSSGGSLDKTEVTFNHKKEDIYIEGFKTVIFYLCAEILALFLPFCIWSQFDKQQAIRKIGLEVARLDSISLKSAHICNFVTKYLHSHGSYVKMFLVTELLNIVFSFMSFCFLFFYWDITPIDALDFFLQEGCGKMCERFPLQTGCTYEQNSIVPELGNDSFETACFLNVNEVNSYIIALLYIWLFFLMVVGVLNFFYRIMQVCLTRFRVFCLKQSAGHFSLNVNIFMLVEVLSFSDYFIILNLSRHVESEVFNNFCNSLFEELNPSVP